MRIRFSCGGFDEFRGMDHLVTREASWYLHITVTLLRAFIHFNEIGPRSVLFSRVLVTLGTYIIFLSIEVEPLCNRTRYRFILLLQPFHVFVLVDSPKQGLRERDINAQDPVN